MNVSEATKSTSVTVHPKIKNMYFWFFLAPVYQVSYASIHKIKSSQVQSNQHWRFFLSALCQLCAKGGGEELFLVNTMASLTYWPLSPAVNGTTTHYNKTLGSVGQDLHNDSAMDFFWPFFPLLLALKIRTAHSAPDFSCKCFVLGFYNLFFRRTSKMTGYLSAGLQRKLLKHPLIFFLHILLSKQLVQLMLKDQNQNNFSQNIK